MSIENLLAGLKQPEAKVKTKDNAQQFISFIELAPSETKVPFFLIYWLYRKWCLQNKVPKKKIVSKHILARALNIVFKKKYEYPKYKKYGVKVDYLLSIYATTPYLPLSKEEEETAFYYYNFKYEQERSKGRKKLWIARKAKNVKEPNTQDLKSDSTQE